MSYIALLPCVKMMPWLPTRYRLTLSLMIFPKKTTLQFPSKFAGLLPMPRGLAALFSHWQSLPQPNFLTKGSPQIQRESEKRWFADIKRKAKAGWNINRIKENNFQKHKEGKVGQSESSARSLRAPGIKLMVTKYPVIENKGTRPQPRFEILH